MLDDDARVRVGEVTTTTDELAAKGVLADVANRVDHTLAHPARIERGLKTQMTLRVMEGCGHFPHREQGDIVADATARWLERECLRRNPASPG